MRCVSVDWAGGKPFYTPGGKKAVLCFTTGGPEATYTDAVDSFNGDMLSILRPIHRGIFEFCGYSVLAPQVCASKSAHCAVFVVLPFKLPNSPFVGVSL